MSPKHSSLAFEEVQEEIALANANFEPELHLLVKTRSGQFMSSSPEVIRIGGRVTVSF